MSMKSIAKKVWNSEIFETVVDVTYGTVECLTDAIVSVFSHNTSDKDRDYYQETYEYWKRLEPCDREFYFNHNEVLQQWGDNYFYNDREQCAKHIAWIAEREGRPFTNKYDRY